MAGQAAGLEVFGADYRSGGAWACLVMSASLHDAGCFLADEDFTGLGLLDPGALGALHRHTESHMRKVGIPRLTDAEETVV